MAKLIAYSMEMHNSVDILAKARSQIRHLFKIIAQLEFSFHRFATLDLTALNLQWIQKQCLQAIHIVFACT